VDGNDERPEPAPRARASEASSAAQASRDRDGAHDALRTVATPGWL